MNCRELVDLVTAYLDGALSTSDQARVEEHLSTCPGCTNHIAQLRVTIELAGALTTDDADPATLEALLSAFRGDETAAEA